MSDPIEPACPLAPGAAGACAPQPLADVAVQRWHSGGGAPQFCASYVAAEVPVALVFTLYIFMRGHNLPGGGFIAGLITALALIIQYIALGQDQAERLLRARSGRLYEIWIGAGLVIAGLTGLGAWFWGRPFLTSAHFYVSPPLIGEMHLATAALFDAGVYITVVGAAMLMISVLGDSRHSSMAGPLPRG